LTNAEIWTALIDWLAGHTGLTVIEAYQAGDRPPLPYLMVNFTGVAELRRHPQDVEYEEDVSTGRVKAFPIIDSEWRFSIHAFGSVPSDLLRPVRSLSHLAQPNEPLMPGLTVSAVSEIRSIPEWVRETWEPRAQMDLMLQGLTRDGVLIDTIEKYEFGFTRV
jgi:hypothetical protein